MNEIMIKKLNRLFLAVVAIVLGTTAASAQTLTVDQTTVKMTTGTTKTIKVLLTSTDATKVRDIRFTLKSDMTSKVVFADDQNGFSPSIVSLAQGYEASYEFGGQVGEQVVVTLTNPDGVAHTTGENVAIASFDIKANESGTVLITDIELSVDGADPSKPETVTSDDIEITVTGYDVASMKTAMTTASRTLGDLKTTIAGYGSYTGEAKSKYIIDAYGQIDAYKTTVDGYVTTLSAQDFEFTETSFNEMSDALDEMSEYLSENGAAALEDFDDKFGTYLNNLDIIENDLALLDAIMEDYQSYEDMVAYCEGLRADDATYTAYSKICLVTPAQIDADTETLVTMYKEMSLDAVDAIAGYMTTVKDLATAKAAYTDGAKAMENVVASMTTKIAEAGTLYDDLDDSATLDDKYARAAEYVNEWYDDSSNYYYNAMTISNSYDNMRTEMAKVYKAYTETYAENSTTPANPVRIRAAKAAYEALVGDTVLVEGQDPVSPKYLYLAAAKNMNGYWMQMNQLYYALEESLDETSEYNAFAALYKGANAIYEELSDTLDTSIGDWDDMDSDAFYKYQNLYIEIPKTIYSTYIEEAQDSDPDKIEIGLGGINTLVGAYNLKLQNAKAAMNGYHNNVESAPATEYAGYMADWNASTGLMADLNTVLTAAIAKYDKSYSDASKAYIKYGNQLTDETDANLVRFMKKYNITDVDNVLEVEAKLNNGQSFRTYGDLLEELDYEIYGYRYRPENIDKRTLKIDSLCAHFIAQSYDEADITMDEKVNIGDYTAMVNYVLRRVTSPTLVQLYKANANNDADDENFDQEIYQPLVDAADVTYVSNVLLGRPTNSRQRGAKAATKKENEVALELVSDEAGVRRFAVKLDNAEDYSAFQFDVTLNGDMVLADRTLGERANGQSIMSNELSENTTRVLATGLNAKTLKEGNEAIAYIDIMGEGEVALSNIRFSTPEATSASAKGVIIAIEGEATGISSVKAEENVEGVYTIGGVKTNKLQKGVNIVNGRKVVK